MAEQEKKERARRTLTPQQRAKIVQQGRRREVPPASEIAEAVGVDVRVVRRVLQAAGLVECKPATRERAQRLVATWVERSRA